MSAPKKASRKPAPRNEAPSESLYHYRARVTAVHDGDTCTVDIDLGMTLWKRSETVRLARINAPELSGASAKKGALSRDHLKSLIEGKDVILATIRDKREKYGRYLGEIWLKRGRKQVNVNDAMVEAGHAEFKTY